MLPFQGAQESGFDRIWRPMGIDVIMPDTGQKQALEGSTKRIYMGQRERRIFIPAVLVLAGAMVASGWAQTQQPPTVKIPEPGVPQIMAIEGEYVRAAYNNEGYVILSYRLANYSIGEPWLLLDVGATLRQSMPRYDLTRGAISLELPDGKTIPLPSNDEFRAANLTALENRAKVTRESINYFPPGATKACRIGFFSELTSGAVAYDEIELSWNRACLGRLYFPIPGGIQYGQYWLNVKFAQSLIRVPFRILTKDEQKLLSKHYKSIRQQVKEAFEPKKK